MAEATTVLTDGTAMAETGRVNATYARRRTAVHRGILQRNGSALRRHTKGNLIRTKAIMAISRTDIGNILPFTKEIMKTNIIKPLKLLS